MDVIGGTVAGGIRKTRPNHGARSGPHGLAMSCRFFAGSYPTAIPCGCTRVAAGCFVNAGATGCGALCARVRERRNAGTLFAFLALGSGTIPPAPRHVICSVPVGWPQTCVPVYWYAVVWFPHVLIMLPLLRPFRRSLSARTKARCQPVVIVSHRAPFPPCQVWRALSPIIARA